MDPIVKTEIARRLLDDLGIGPLLILALAREGHVVGEDALGLDVLVEAHDCAVARISVPNPES